MNHPMRAWRATVVAAALATVTSLGSSPAHARDVEPALLEIYKTLPNGKTREYVGGIVQMETVFTEPGSGCTQMIGTIKVEGVQFSKSGAVLELIRFRDNKGNQWAVPTSIEKLPKLDREKANNFIKTGRSYFSHIQVCGSGGFADLISLYDRNISMGAFE